MKLNIIITYWCLYCKFKLYNITQSSTSFKRKCSYIHPLQPNIHYSISHSFATTYCTPQASFLDPNTSSRSTLSKARMLEKRSKRPGLRSIFMESGNHKRFARLWGACVRKPPSHVTQLGMYPWLWFHNMYVLSLQYNLPSKYVRAGQSQ